MMNINKLSKQTLEQIEINALAWQTMTHMARGETLQMNGVYIRMMDMLRKRAIELETTDTAPKEKNDWLALALFAKDREKFVELCEHAKKSRDIMYLRAEPWLRQVLKAEEAAEK